MQRSRLKSLTLIASLAVLTIAVLAATGRGKPPAHPPADPLPAGGSGITLSGHLVQTHVLKGSPGRVGLELTLAAVAPAAASADDRGIDFVVVLDRSGSMEGAKLEYARRSLQHLLASLNARDRFALFSYSDAVQKQCDLLPVTDANRSLMHAAVAGIRSGGATNLGEGLRAGIELITAASRPGHPGRVILISDGLANRGVTDPSALAGMAATAAGREFAVSTVGVGADFNEFLMTQIADRGAGSYYYLDNPSAFAEVFQREAVSAKTAAATGVSVSIPLPPGVRLVGCGRLPGQRLRRPRGLLPRQPARRSDPAVLPDAAGADRNRVPVRARRDHRALAAGAAWNAKASSIRRSRSPASGTPTGWPRRSTAAAGKARCSRRTTAGSSRRSPPTSAPAGWRPP